MKYISKKMGKTKEVEHSEIETKSLGSAERAEHGPKSPMFVQYINIIAALKKYRGFTDLKPDFTTNEKEFTKKILDNKYVVAIHKDIYVFIVAKNASIQKKSADFKSMLNVVKNASTAYIYMSGKPNHTVMKKINEIKEFRIILMDTAHYNIDIQRGPHCGVHTTLTAEEVARIIEKENLLTPDCLPRILETDPQVRLIGACVGDVIRIESDADHGPRINYRIVVHSYETRDPAKKKETKKTTDADETDDDQLVSDPESIIEDEDFEFEGEIEIDDDEEIAEVEEEVVSDGEDE